MSEPVALDMSNGGDKTLQLVWSNLSMSLTVESDKIEKQSKSLWNMMKSEKTERTVLQPMSGRVESGSLTAIMGPSGAGKSTLLNLITGKMQVNKSTHIRGSCFLSLSSSSSASDQRISFVPQRDSLFRSFTVRETLLFSAKMNDPLQSPAQHEEKMKDITHSLDLKDYVNFPLSKLSGGQLKRVSIANEMITSPTILVLDEPTSGLDSDTAESLIKLLKRMCRSTTVSPYAPAILATIHSPSFEVFCTFDSIYLLNKNGANIYNGPPTQITRYFSDVGFNNVHGNPADFAIEVANGKYGGSKFSRMQQLSFTSADCPAQKSSDIDMFKWKQQPRCSTVRQVVHLTSRSLSSCFIKSPQSIIVALMHLATSLLLVHLPHTPLGVDPICWEYFRPWDQIDRSNFTASDLIYEIKLQLNNESKMKNMSVVSNFVYFSSGYLMFIHATIASVLMPFEMVTVRREMANYYYTIRSYCLSKLLCDSLVILATIMPAALYIYFVSHQLTDVDNLWRVAFYAFFVYLMSLISHIAGLSIGLLVPDILFAIAVVVALVLCNMFLSEFFITVNLMAWYFAFLPSIMPLQAFFSLFVITLYGFNRCDVSGTLKTISLSGFDDPKDSFAKMWWFLNFEKEDMRRQASVYDTEVDYMYSLYDHVVKWLGPRRELTHPSPNYMLDFFHLTDDLSRHFLKSVGWLLIVIGILWYSLSTRCRVSRL